MSQIEETLGGLRIIKAFNAEKKIQDRFERSNDTFRRLTNRIYRRQQMAHPMSEFLVSAAPDLQKPPPLFYKALSQKRA